MSFRDYQVEQISKEYDYAWSDNGHIRPTSWCNTLPIWLYLRKDKTKFTILRDRNNPDFYMEMCRCDGNFYTVLERILIALYVVVWIILIIAVVPDRAFDHIGSNLSLVGVIFLMGAFLWKHKEWCISRIFPLHNAVIIALVQNESQ